MIEPAIRQTVIGDHNIFSATGDIHIVYQLPPAEAEDHRNLLVLLNKVRKFWVEGVLEQSIHHEALIQLGKESRPNMVAHPWERILELPKASRSLTSEKHIGEIFEETGRTLLIVGEPGSGKTLTLLELARDLITRVPKDPTQPIPSVFNLSSWTEKRQPIVDWLVSELSTKYQIPKRFGRPWLENHRLLLLLDGLDEVDPKHRATCVTFINEFVEQIGLPGLAVCSRLREYLALPTYLKLSGAICLQPLIPSQIEDYFCKAGPRLASLHTALQDDPVLQELAETPLMLNVMTLAYQDLPVEALVKEEAETLEGRRQHLFDAYIERMFKRKGITGQPYTASQVINWLSWLAQRMTQYSKTVFLLEELQPSWLLTRRQILGYALSSRMILGCLAWLIMGLVFWLVRLKVVPIEAPLDIPLWMIGLITGIVTGLLFLKRSKKENSISNMRVVKDWNELWFMSRFYSLLLPIAMPESTRNDIQAVEALSWSWSGARRGTIVSLYSFLGIILLCSILPGLLSWLYNEPMLNVIVWLIGGVIIGVGAGLCLSIIFTIMGGLRRGIVVNKTSANQGITSSIRNSFLGIIIFGLGLGVSVGLFLGLYCWLIEGLISLKLNISIWGKGLIDWISFGLVIGLAVGLFLGLLASLAFGGMDAIKHYLLRLILAWRGYAPLNYVRFLDYAAKLIFLRKVGGGYIFIHRMFMEHFAAIKKNKQAVTDGTG
jgi:eukaryotic-like serine/threonine-protein kinase